MKFYKPYKRDRLMCILCQHYCKIKEGQSGICGVNKNVGGKIECLVYGYPSSINVDPIEKKPLYHFLPGSKAFSFGTVGCNFHCPFCQNWGISQTREVDTSRYFSPELIVQMAIDNDCRSIAYTYNEPTIFYPYARDISFEAKRRGLKNVFVTNGFESGEMIDDMKGIMDAVNVDLKSFDAKYYKKELGGDLEKILENLKHFVANGIWTEVTTLVIPTQNDSEEELSSIAAFIANELGVDVPWHITAFHPDYKSRDLPRTSTESLDRAYDIGKKHGLRYVYKGNITQESPTLCPACAEVVIERDHFKNIRNFLKGSHCPKCGTAIEGVFDEQ
jgi:pyruvate formate lyase activating enzyme